MVVLILTLGFISALFLFYWVLVTLAIQYGLFKNKFLFGFCWGLLAVLACVVLIWLNKTTMDKSSFGAGFVGFKDSTVGLVGICTNLIPTFFADKRKMDEFVRGIMIPTVLLAIGWFVYFNPLGL